MSDIDPFLTDETDERPQDTHGLIDYDDVVTFEAPAHLTDDYDPSYRPAVRTITPLDNNYGRERKPLLPAPETDWWHLRGTVCTCPPGCTDTTWGDAGTCDPDCLTCHLAQGVTYTKPPKNKKTNKEGAA